ncbi:ribonuclease Y [bacterium]|jgi:ribonucrease Y|nr:ribonuclease Y [bacterium]MBT6831765.1 ribonuclease Y [bacterium]MBT6996588.1 ribonuclease Y [bacterium]MBT7772914.1 ribonuclease Y [bacterium]
MNILTFALAGSGLLVGVLATYLVVRPKARLIEETARREAERVRRDSEKDRDRVLSDARKHADLLRENVRREEVQLRERLERAQAQADERATKREEVLDQKIEKSETAREQYLQGKKELDTQKEALEKALDVQNEKLEEISKLKKDDAKQELLDRMESEVAPQLAKTMERKVEDMRQNADEKASEIIVQSIQRYASSVSGESTITTVKIESDTLKGKIIGREGRNINAFEQLTGVDVIIDDTPGAITLSSFDMFRRYVAKVALEDLLKDGRIHPSKIEELVKNAQNKAEKLILELGQKAAQDLGVTGFPEAILKLVGRLRFRTSYGQNVLSHSIEVAYLAEAVARELPGADPEVCKKAGLVHDIGKAVSHEVEGGHAVIGKEILEKFGVDKRVIAAMMSHHEDFPYESIEARILQAADAISASRPGARKETLEKYIRRLKELEAIAGSFPGVEKVFAIQAGREVRVFVNAAEMDDLAAEKLSFECARKIEDSCEYPGEVRVAVFRESRYENTAK